MKITRQQIATIKNFEQERYSELLEITTDPKTETIKITFLMGLKEKTFEIVSVDYAHEMELPYFFSDKENGYCLIEL